MKRPGLFWGSPALNEELWRGDEAYTHALQVSDAHKVEIQSESASRCGVPLHDGVRLYNGGCR